MSAHILFRIPLTVSIPFCFPNTLLKQQ